MRRTYRRRGSHRLTLLAAAAVMITAATAAPAAAQDGYVRTLLLGVAGTGTADEVHVSDNSGATWSVRDAATTVLKLRRAADDSTIYVGGDDGAFSAYGDFHGLAEGVDRGNADPGDGAFVFTETIPSVARSANGYAMDLAPYVIHEAAHLLGFAHTEAPGKATVLSPRRKLWMPSQRAATKAPPESLTSERPLLVR